jgi:hypothetical protein
MGNFNSGRYGGKAKCEQFLFIDVRMLTRKNVLKNGHQLTGTWPNGSKMGITVRTHSIDLQYSIDGGSSNIYPISLDYTDCNYGGQRAWFKCPRCGTRNAKLFVRSGRFACRSCHRLVYRTQVLDPIARNQHAYHRAQSKLDEHEMKPKGMHWRTFDRICERMDLIDGRINQVFNLSAMRLFKRVGII